MTYTIETYTLVFIFGIVTGLITVAVLYLLGSLIYKRFIRKHLPEIEEIVFVKSNRENDK